MQSFHTDHLALNDKHSIPQNWNKLQLCAIVTQEDCQDDILCATFDEKTNELTMLTMERKKI